MRKRLLSVAVLATALTGMIAGAAGAAQPGPALSFDGNRNQLTCFDGTTEGDGYGLCSTKYGVATLDNASNDKTPANPADQYSGVYLKKSALVGKAIRDVKQLGFSYRGSATAGSPRISLGFDANGDGKQDDYAFISAYYCNDGAGNVDAVNDPTCTIYTGSGPYANWAALVAAHPDYRVVGTPFVIADDPGVWTVFDVKLGQVLARVSNH
jgi:hypothetical protein